jgi:hypothetical protein
MAKLNDSDIIYNSLPMYHGFGGFICIGIALFHGCTVVMKRKFSASNFWKDCIRHNCTVSIEANVTYQLVYNIFFFLKRLSCILVSYADIWSISQLRTLRLNIKSDWQSVMAWGKTSGRNLSIDSEWMFLNSMGRLRETAP